MTTGGWNIIKDYQPKVLINNWFEERLKYDKEHYLHNSTYRKDYSSTSLPYPDVILRRKNWLRGDGIGGKTLLSHHGHVYDDNLITLYDQEINRRERRGRNVLPPLRHWDSVAMRWVPEKSDFPIYDQPTNWGLFESRRRRWASAEDGLATTYSASYTEPAAEAYTRQRRLRTIGAGQMTPQ